MLLFTKSLNGVGMKRKITLAAIALSSAALLGATVPSPPAPAAGLSQLMYAGYWKIQPPAKDGSVNFGLSYPASMSNNTDFMPMTRLGLTPEALHGPNHPIEFQLKTEAGTFVCRGNVADGAGSGAFAFVPDEAYAKSYDAVRSRRLTPRQQVQAGIFDLSTAYVDAVASAGFGDAAFDTLVGFKIFGVTPELLRTLHSDFPTMDPSEVVGIWMTIDKQHVDLHALHLDFPNEEVDAIVALASAGVTPAYVAALRSADVRGLTAEGVAVLRMHGVSQAFADSLATKGPHGLSIDEVVRLAK